MTSIPASAAASCRPHRRLLPAIILAAAFASAWLMIAYANSWLDHALRAALPKCELRFVNEGK